MPTILGTQLGRTGNVVTAYHGPGLINFAEKTRSTRLQVKAPCDSHPRPADDTVTCPHHTVFPEPGDNIVPTLLLPPLDIFGTHPGYHIYMTAGAASETGNAFIPFGCRIRDVTGDPFHADLMGRTREHKQARPLLPFSR